MRLSFFRILAITCATGFFLGALAAPSQYTIERWTHDDGLPDKSVFDLLQTSDGYLWIATQYGVARFDGRRMVVFNHGNTPAMVNDDCRTLCEDRDGNLWIGTRDGVLRLGNGFSRFNLRTGLVDPENKADPSAENIVNCLHADQSGNLWAGTVGGLFLYDGQRFKRFGDAEAYYLRRDILCITEDANGGLWIGTVCGPCARPAGHSEILPVHFESLPAEGRATFSLTADAQGDILAVAGRPNSENRHLYRLTGDQGWQRISPAATEPEDLAFFHVDTQGTTWWSGQNPTLFWNRGGRSGSIQLPLAATDDCARNVLEDWEGNLWIGTDSSGLLRLRPRTIEAWGQREGLPHPNAWTICEDHKGAVWIGTDGGVTRILNGATKTWTTHDGLVRNDVRSLAEDLKGRMWVGTGSGLSVIREDSIENLHFEGDWAQTKVRALLTGRDGSIWVGTARGLHRLRGGQHAAWFNSPTNEVDVRVILESVAGEVWIGTYGQGLLRLHDDEVTAYTQQDGLPSGFVWALHEDEQGALWIGTDRGLARLLHGQFARLTTAEGLPDSLVNHILQDDLGRLWISHDRGIYRVPLVELHAAAEGRQSALRTVSYGEPEGLPSAETNGQKSQPAGWRTCDGRLWFPTTQGVAVIDPHRLPDTSVGPQIVIEEIFANGVKVFDNAANYDAKVFRAEGNAYPPLSLLPGTAHVMEVRFTGVTFAEADEVRFRYRLDGVDKNWIQAGSSRQAYYTNLKPGDYAFEVKAESKYLTPSPTLAVLPIRYAPFFYQTTWFAAACAAGLAGLLVAVYLIRVRCLKRVHGLEAEVARFQERERLARDLHDGLGANLTEICLLADLQNPTGTANQAASGVSQLARATRDALQTLREIIWVAKPSTDTLEGVALRIGDYAQGLLASGKVRCRLDIPEDLPDVRLPSEVKQTLLFVAKESLTNTLKHAQATEVIFSVARRVDRIVLAFSDNGRGFTPESSPAGPVAKGALHGNGLPNLRHRLAAIGGKLVLHSTINQGTTLAVEIPLPPC